MPTIGAHIPDDSPLLKGVLARAKDQHAGKVSSYVRDLIERDLGGAVNRDAMSPTILVDLTRELLGRIDAEELEGLLGDESQPRALKEILGDYLATTRTARARALAGGVSDGNKEAVAYVSTVGGVVKVTPKGPVTREVVR